MPQGVPDPAPDADPALDEMLAEAAELPDAGEAIALCRELLARGARTDGLVHTSGLDAATRELVLAAARKFPPPVYPDGTHPIVWPPAKDTKHPGRR